MKELTTSSETPPSHLNQSFFLDHLASAHAEAIALHACRRHMTGLEGEGGRQDEAAAGKLCLAWSNSASTQEH